MDSIVDELLDLILGHTLVIPDSEFSRLSTCVFARLDARFASSSSMLLVCKRWLRVATPLLYGTVVVRSVGQAHALADAFTMNPPFARYVRRLRIEGAWDGLGTILKSCTRIRVLFLALHIWSNDSVTGLCSGLSQINPAHVIICDEHALLNAKLRKVVTALGDAIPKWTNLVCNILSPLAYGLRQVSRHDFVSPL